MSGQLHALAAPPGERGPPYPLDGRLGGSQNRSGRHGEEKIVAPTGTTLGRPARTQSLCRLQYPGSQFYL
jgi:hypothetical protein